MPRPEVVNLIGASILNKEGLDYVFPHRSLQEYFASLYIVTLDEINKAEIYKRILQDFNEKFDGFLFISKDNFYSLLVEQDPIGVSQNLSIPFFKQVLEKRSHATRGSLFGVIDKLYSFILSFNLPFQDNHQLLQICTEFIKRRRTIIQKAISRRESDAEIKFTQDELNEMKKDASATFKKIKPLLPTKISELENFLREEIESDSKIIDMII